MRIRNVLAALAVAAVVAHASPASAGPNSNVYYGHAPNLLQAAVIITMLSSASVVFNALLVNHLEKRQLALQEAYLAAGMPFAWVVLQHQRKARAPRRR